jgi:hypothetical protein
MCLWCQSSQPLDRILALANMQGIIVNAYKRKPREYMYKMMPDLMLYCAIKSADLEDHTNTIDGVSHWDISRIVICTFLQPLLLL